MDLDRRQVTPDTKQISVSNQNRKPLLLPILLMVLPAFIFIFARLSNTIESSGMDYGSFSSSGILLFLFNPFLTVVFIMGLIILLIRLGSPSMKGSMIAPTQDASKSVSVTTNSTLKEYLYPLMSLLLSFILFLFGKYQEFTNRTDNSGLEIIVGLPYYFSAAAFFLIGLILLIVVIARRAKGHK